MCPSASWLSGGVRLSSGTVAGVCPDTDEALLGIDAGPYAGTRPPSRRVWPSLRRLRRQGGSGISPGIWAPRPHIGRRRTNDHTARATSHTPCFPRIPHSAPAVLSPHRDHSLVVPPHTRLAEPMSWHPQSPHPSAPLTLQLSGSLRRLFLRGNGLALRPVLCCTGQKHFRGHLTEPRRASFPRSWRTTEPRGPPQSGVTLICCLLRRCSRL
ncbi:hypothetical protein HRbin28_00163 [bacterium HR28]|nr:hypothetical protein HRbin28_00163 [bacterium HR28]